MQTYHPINTKGMALVTVLMLGAVLLTLLVSMTTLTLANHKIGSTSRLVSESKTHADNYSEQIRLTVIKNYQDAGISLPAWLNLVAPCRIAQPTQECTPNPSNSLVADLAGDHPKSTLWQGKNVDLTWKLTRVSAANASSSWLEYQSTAQIDAQTQTIVRKINFLNNSMFGLALYGENLNSFFAYSTVRGNVGFTKSLDPYNNTGFGNEVRIEGSIYAAPDAVLNRAVNDDQSGNWQPGMITTGSISTGYLGGELPADSDWDGAIDYPAIDKSTIATAASGFISGGSIQVVPEASNWAHRYSTTTLSNTYTGNVVLSGTTSNPLQINGNVYVSNDVVIQGVVTGKGVIYAGRNMYIAGNVTNKNKADKLGSGVCAGLNDANLCAINNINAGKDELRLMATNNIILGDYSEKDGSGNTKTWDAIGASEYFRKQFGLTDTTAKYFRKGSNEELFLDSVTGKYYDSLNKEVPATEVFNSATSANTYEVVMAPGYINAGGLFGRWMTDAEYQAFLGYEVRSAVDWQKRILFKDANGVIIPNATIQSGLVAAGLPQSLTKVQYTTWSGQGMVISDMTYDDFINGLRNGIYNSSAYFEGPDKDNRYVSGYLNYRGNGDDAPPNSVMLAFRIDESKTFIKEVTALDAFLYAGQRVVGQITDRGGYVNGGIIAKEVGINAQGRFWCDSTNTEHTEPDADNSERPGVGNSKCRYTINYDARMTSPTGTGFGLLAMPQRVSGISWAKQ